MLRADDDSGNTPDAGTRRKADALEAHESRHELELLIVRREFAKHLLAYGFASLNDVDLPPWLCGNFLGSVHRPFVSGGMIAEIRMVKNCRPNCNGRRIVEWGLIDRPALEAWLRSNPPDDPSGTAADVTPPSLPSLDTATETPAAPLLGFGRNGSPAAQRLLFDGDEIREGSKHAA